MKRYPTDLSHFTVLSGDMGRLQTISSIPVIAGDSIQINFGAVFRMAALRRGLTLDAQVDLFAFYVKHRHIYGSDWEDFLKQGVDESVTLTAGPAQGTGHNYMGFRPLGSGNYPLWQVAGYNRIWNEYFRAPSVAGDILSDSALVTGLRGVLYGKLSGRLPTPWSTGVDGEPDATDREVAAVTVLDILDLVNIQARYHTESQRTYFANRYRDIIREAWGGKANVDSDERPTLLMRSKNTLSGYDIDGTSDASLGTYSGKSAATLRLNVPRRYFPEHGHIKIMALIRFPTIFQQESHYLNTKTNPSYLEFAGDPTLVGVQPPQKVTADQFFATSTTTDYGHVPYGQWYRHHPNYVHQAYANVGGFPFQFPFPGSAAAARYHVTNEYDPVFSSVQLGQWSSVGHVAMLANRVVPPAARSIFAGGRG